MCVNVKFKLIYSMRQRVLFFLNIHYKSLTELLHIFILAECVDRV